MNSGRGWTFRCREPKSRLIRLAAIGFGRRAFCSDGKGTCLIRVSPYELTGEALEARYIFSLAGGACQVRTHGIAY